MSLHFCIKLYSDCMVLLIDSLLVIYIFNIPTVHNVLFVKSSLLKGEVKPRKQMDRRGK